MAIDPRLLEGDMAAYAAVYFSILIVFAILDAIWLTKAGQALYRPVLGDILADTVRVAPAIVFYLMYPLGVAIFAVVPALRANSLQHAVVHGALFGLFAYATYDLTNHATMRNWATHITLIDMAWGAFLTGISATLAYLASRALIAHFELRF